jgi:hypothetical protein
MEERNKQKTARGYYAIARVDASYCLEGRGREFKSCEDERWLDGRTG